MHKDVEELLSRGVTTFIDPDQSFRTKLEQKIRGEYDKDIVIKLGIDPTRPDIHLGFAVVLRKLRQFQDAGCKAVLIVGDATARIGDPEGKSKVRPELSQEEINKNMQTYVEQVGKILNTDEKVFSWIANSDWFVSVTDIGADPRTQIEIEGKQVDPNSFVGKALIFENTRMQKTVLKKNQIINVSFLQFISTLRGITHSKLIARDMFQERIKKGDELYMHEMIYPVMQGIDSVAIAQIYGSCDLEMGGSDQTFNMLLGRDIMKTNKLPEQAVMAMEILTGLDGNEKMSKSLDNYIAITEEPSQMFGKMMSVPDNLIPEYFRLATYTPLSEVEKIVSGHPKEAKVRLAHEIVAIYHGEKAAQEAEENFSNTFSKGGIPSDVETVHAPFGKPLVEILMDNGLVKSKTEFNRLEKAGAISEIENGVYRVGKHRFLKVVFD